MPIPRPRTLVFDLDGTLLDTLGDITVALGRALVARGYSAKSRDAVARMVGDGARVLCARATGMDPGNAEVEDVLRAFLEAYEADPTPTTSVMPGALVLLDALGDRGIPAVVCTNKPGALSRIIVERLFGARIRATVGGGDTPRLKPDPAPILAALSHVEVPVEHAWMIGDSAQDIGAARAASVFAIGYRCGYGNVEGADLAIDALDCLIEFL